MNYFSMFSGIGGFELGIERATKGEWGCIGFSEIDKYAIRTYRKHYPNHRNFGDATKIEPIDLPDFDVLVGGFPCQAFSIAGKRRGFNDTRGTLFFEIARILKSKKPSIVLLENVKGLLNHQKGETFRVILQTMEELGYDIQWMVLNSRFFGVPQNRERVFIIGYLRETSGREILLFRGSNKKDIEYERKEIKELTGNEPEIGRVYSPDGLAPTLHGKTGGWQEPKILDLSNARRDDGTRGIREYSRVSPTITGRDYKEPRCVMVNLHQWRTGEYGDGMKEKESFTLDIGCGRDYCIWDTNVIIRRLIPIECERLQGFPDGYTEYGIDENNNQVKTSDTQRYKQLGNAVTVNVIKAIVERMI